MADDTDTTVDIEDNLEDFEAEFYGTTETVTVEDQQKETPEEVDENESDQLATDTDEDEEKTDDEEDDSETDSEDEDEEDEEEDEPKPAAKKNRKSARERIEELVAKNREAERREAELTRRLEQLEARNKEVDKPTDVREVLSADAPSPDAVDEDGEPLYPLGEFDPLFIRDLTRFTVMQETKAAKEQEAREREAQAMEQARRELAESWIERVDEAEKEIPDLREHMRELTDTFANIEPAYGEYLASTIMLSEAGPQIMDYLSQNIGEAQKIVASGPAAATLALGRLEARLLSSTKRDEESDKPKKVSTKAPAPPEDRVRGSGGKFAVAPDTDNLDAFEKEFFK